MTNNYDPNGSYIMPAGDFDLTTGKHALRYKNPDPYGKKKTLTDSWFNFDDPESMDYKQSYIHIILEDTIVHPQGTGLRFVVSCGDMRDGDEKPRTFYHDQTHRRLFDGNTVKTIPCRDYRKLKEVCKEFGYSIGKKVKFYVYK